MSSLTDNLPSSVRFPQFDRSAEREPLPEVLAHITAIVGEVVRDAQGNVYVRVGNEIADSLGQTFVQELGHTMHSINQDKEQGFQLVKPDRSGCNLEEPLSEEVCDAIRYTVRLHMPLMVKVEPVTKEVPTRE